MLSSPRAATLKALDVIFLEERESGAINRLSVERLAKKALGLIKAYGGVNRLEDWKRQKNAGKDWKSKVNWAEAKRYDPQLTQEEVMRIESNESEVRKKMEQDALLLKVKLKLEDKSSSAHAKEPFQEE